MYDDYTCHTSLVVDGDGADGRNFNCCPRSGHDLCMTSAKTIVLLPFTTKHQMDSTLSDKLSPNPIPKCQDPRKSDISLSLAAAQRAW